MSVSKLYSFIKYVTIAQSAVNCHLNVIQKDEQRSDRMVVTDGASLSKSLESRISDDQKASCTAGVQRVDGTCPPPGERNAQQRRVPARFDRPRLSLSSVSSCSSGEFIPPAQPPAYEPRAAENGSSADYGSAVSISEIRSMSREQVIRLLSRQQDELSRQERELSNLNSGIQMTQMYTH